MAEPQLDAARRNARLTWTAKAADGKPVLSSVYYSANGGEFYGDELFEERAGRATVALDPAPDAKHVFKIVVTDGARSAERILRLP